MHTAFRVPFVKAAFGLVAFASLVCLPGCPDNTAQNQLSGTVTLGEQNVGGNIYLLGPDGKTEVSSPVMDGKYTIPNPPVGKCKIKLTGEMIPGGVAPPANKGPLADSANAKEVGKDLASKGGAASVTKGFPPPEKYKNYENGLTVEVKQGKITHDFKLAP